MNTQSQGKEEGSEYIRFLIENDHVVNPDSEENPDSEVGRTYEIQFMMTPPVYTSFNLDEFATKVEETCQARRKGMTWSTEEDQADDQVLTLVKNSMEDYLISKGREDVKVEFANDATEADFQLLPEVESSLRADPGLTVSDGMTLDQLVESQDTIHGTNPTGGYRMAEFTDSWRPIPEAFGGSILISLGGWKNSSEVKSE